MPFDWELFEFHPEFVCFYVYCLSYDMHKNIVSVVLPLFTLYCHEIDASSLYRFQTEKKCGTLVHGIKGIDNLSNRKTYYMVFVI